MEDLRLRGQPENQLYFCHLLSMLSDCDPPTFQRRCEKPKKLQRATSQQQTTLQPETEGVVETGDVEKQNWYRLSLFELDGGTEKRREVVRILKWFNRE